ncbi:hypothetical protein BS50DRAFT_274578 [Corynespora cassiicola Philippines]|uniref:Uncharacterized protein n=1 Tax=Corynespora cassiicola Philippines TaxID=1448308 RepID=A0A2T2P0T5_CORCC|nr:hypothetical protein BS50DRAFT_274578 [Corynespora cassiicola Philippines]
MVSVNKRSSRYQAQLNSNGNISSPDDTTVTPQGSPPLIRRSSSGLGLFKRFRKQSTESTATSQTLPTPPGTPRPTSPMVIAFVNSLKSTQLSDFLCWWLFYDVVTLPSSPSKWYRQIDSMEMRGWIALGETLSKKGDFGFELVVLDSICDRLGLSKALIHECLIYLAIPEKMAWTSVAHIINEARLTGESELSMLKQVHVRLCELGHIASHLKPTENTFWSQQHPVIIDRIRSFLGHVLEPKIFSLDYGLPLSSTALGQDGVSVEADRDRHLVYLFECISTQERPVPLIRYGIFPDYQSILSTSSSPFDIECPPILDETQINKEITLDHTYSTAKIRAENHDLRHQNAELTRQNKNLIKADEKFARKISTLGRVQPELYKRPLWSGHGNRVVETPHHLFESTCSRSMFFSHSQNSEEQPAKFSQAFRRASSFTDEAVGSIQPPQEYNDEFKALTEQVSEALIMISVLMGDETIQQNGPQLDKLNDNRDDHFSRSFNLDKTGPEDISSSMSRSISAKSRETTSTVRSGEPGPHNSIAEHQARAMNIEEVQSPIEGYCRNSNVTTSISPAKVAGIVRRISGARMNRGKEAKEKGREWSKRSTNLGWTIKDTKGVRPKQELNVSTNF